MTAPRALAHNGSHLAIGGLLMTDLPSGTVTLLFSDIEGSTRLSRVLGSGFADTIEEHRRLLREVFARHSGIEVGTEGDSFFVAFEDAPAAMSAAVEAQRLLGSHQWSAGTSVKVRMGLHSGTPVPVAGDYLGYDVHRASRIASSAHGGQVVVSAATRHIAGAPVEDISFLDLGEHQLKDLDRPEHLYQLVAEGLPEHFPPLRSLSPVRNNLPESLSSFVGRRSELERLCALVEDHRLVTVTGPGGTGKTRLALEAARRLAPSYPSGIWFVELGTTTDPQLVLQTIALTIGLRDITGRQPIEAIAEYAEGKQMLLVLDNFEHVMAAVPEVGSLIQATSGLDVLVTSREVLHLRGERELRVPPLRLPRSLSRPAAELEQYESVRLFVERTRETVSDFELTDSNAAAIAAICQRLDGLPLAIELVVARIKVQSPRELLRRLDRALALLTSGSRDLPERQRNLRSTIEWSFDLLGRDEQVLLARISVFHGRVDMATVEAVCADSDIDTVSVLSALVDKSLVQHGPGNGGAAFWMLQTVREFAREKLEEHGDSEHCLREHAEHYRQVAVQAATEFFGPRQVAWLDRIDREGDDIQAAIRWCLQAGAVDRAALICEGVHAYWWVRGHYGTGRYWVRQVLAAGVGDPVMRARMLVADARLGMQQGAYREANASLVEAYETAQKHQDEPLAARVLSERFALRIKSAEFGVEDPPTGALDFFRRVGDVVAEGELLIRIGGEATLSGRFSEAIGHFERAVSLLRPTGNLWGLAAALNNIGFLTALEGRFAEALPLLHESREMYRTVQTKEGLASVSDSMALVMAGLGDLDEAITYYEQSVELFRDIGNRGEVASVLAHLGRARLEQGELERAAGCLREALEISTATNDPEVQAFALDGTAALMLRTGQSRPAARLFAAAARLRVKEDVALAPADQRRLDRELATVVDEVAPEDRAAATEWAEETPPEALFETALAATRSVATARSLTR
ncbi:MAG: hypothetical protein AVDCRST_MAG72-502 [uncultured Nocardioidaceae bacterium]|uniref:Guanylate cyclase domain-containing protein n=1 Tax=uncultured Nocardioidaceae bacterium TaxID=253824 RepID=A0A6J4LLU7_9ACTN|nr:MAG: hypothetical protein AVDCRST_MAG72-502 [uncultured Nocardioidaceae bacterium]